MKKKLVNAQTDKDVNAFIDSIENQVRQADARVLLDLLQDITGDEPKIWGKSIIGYGKYSYQRKNGDEFEWFNVGFSPGKAHMTMYVMYNINEQVELLQQLGPHKTGKGCLYVKRLEQIDLSVLRMILEKSHRWRSENS